MSEYPQGLGTKTPFHLRIQWFGTCSCAATVIWWGCARRDQGTVMSEEYAPDLNICHGLLLRWLSVRALAVRLLTVSEPEQ